jgi:hypothetical protein
MTTGRVNRSSSVTTKKWARMALTHPAFTGISRQHLSTLIVKLADQVSASGISCVLSVSAALPSAGLRPGSSSGAPSRQNSPYLRVSEKASALRLLRTGP